MVDLEFVEQLAKEPIPDGELYSLSYDEVEDARKKVDWLLSKKDDLSLKRYARLNRLKTNILVAEDYIADPKGLQYASKK